MGTGDTAKAIGSRIAEARADKGISQTTLARTLKLSRSAVAQWEIGKTSPSTENLSDVAVELEVSFEWLATKRGPKRPPEFQSGLAEPKIHRIPVISWVSAGQLISAQSQIPVEDADRFLFLEGLGQGEYFALKVVGESMDKYSAEGSIIVVDQADREPIPGKAYVFWHRDDGETYKIWQEDPHRLEPHSSNTSLKPRYIKRKKDYAVIGRVRRSMLDL